MAHESTTTTPANAHQPLKGIAAICIAVVFFSHADALAKWFGAEGFSAVQIVFFRYLFGLVPVAIAVWVAGRQALQTRRPVAHIVRAMLMCVSLVLFFRGLRGVPLADSIAVAFTAPLFITALSVPILGERVGLQRWLAVLTGFAGMLVIIRPGSGAFRPESMFIVTSAFTFALAVLYTRRISKTETNTAIFCYTTLLSLAVTAPFAALSWQVPGDVHLGFFAVLGLIGGAAHFLVIVAYRHAPAAVVAPMEYSALIWGALLGWLIWREQPDGMVWAGAAIIVMAGAFIAWREHQRSVRSRVIGP